MSSRLAMLLSLIALLAAATPAAVGHGVVDKNGLPVVPGFPSQPIRLVVYTSPGGLIDVTARRFARLAQEHAEHPFAVINRPGGGGIVAFEEALREPADGHRFLAVTRSNISKMVATGREDLIDRLHWHAYVMDNAHVLITNAAEGPADWDALRRTPGDQLWLGVDIGGVKHVSGVRMAETVGIDMRWIPYASGGEAVAALLGNLGTVYLGNPRDAQTSDRLRIVAVAAEQRLPEFPDAPTFVELGFDGLEDELIWRGFAFRKEVPEPIRDWYTAVIRKVLDDPRWQEAWAGEAVNLRYRDAEAFTRIVERDRSEFRTYLGQLGLLPDAQESHGTLAALGRGLGLYGAVGGSALMLGGLAFMLPRTRHRQWTGQLLLLGALGFATVIALLMSIHLPAANPIDPVGAAGIPRLWMLLLLPLIVLQIGYCLRAPPPEPETQQTLRLLVSMGLFIGYLLLLPVLGYLPATLIYMPTLIVYLGYRRMPVIAAVTVSWLLFSELIFQRLLLVDLPRGMWW
ncbi:MAG: tripartite tricarboxylate transporter substrate binding protein [Gammaproteobacteria bacterium]|nr:MAG: tripartite tricarboxylate transporter substrate binding protein [Gammaproteobacteria bacterium]